MVVDFHTHVFPERIAKKTIALLAERGNIPAYTDGTLEGLQEQLVKAGVDFSVALPVLTRPQSFESVLSYAQTVNEGYFKREHDVYSFAGIHPDCEDIEGKMRQIKEAGFQGVKIHPDYQATFIDEEGYIRILNAAVKEDLIVLTHAGLDVGYPELVRCTPQRAVRALEKVTGEPKFVLAHYGGNEDYGAVYELLAGKNVYFDTGYILERIAREEFYKILEKHGDDKVLFASDCPWQDIAKTRAYFSALQLPKASEEKILYKNALKLLGKKVWKREN